MGLEPIYMQVSGGHIFSPGRVYKSKMTGGIPGSLLLLFAQYYCNRTLAETSANTGFYIYFLSTSSGKKMHIESLPVSPLLFLALRIGMIAEHKKNNTPYGLTFI